MSERAAVKRLIDEAARRHLRPMGLRQKGRSRLWFDDRGWSLITVEFQPGFGVGTYLNVAVTWLWYDHGGVWTLDEGGRVWWRDDGEFTTDPPHAPGWQQWAQFLREHIFAKEMDIVAGVAARCVWHFREQFPDPCATARQPWCLVECGLDVHHDLEGVAHGTNYGDRRPGQDARWISGAIP